MVSLYRRRALVVGHSPSMVSNQGWSAARPHQWEDNQSTLAPLGAERLLFGGRLDPNQASREALMLLPGIGPARAGAITTERRKKPFGSLEDLDRVPGIGPGTIEKLRPWLELEPGVADR